MLSGTSARRPPESDDNIKLPVRMRQPFRFTLDSPVPPVSSHSVVSLGAPWEEVVPGSPYTKDGLVLEQVADYCLPALEADLFLLRPRPSLQDGGIAQTDPSRNFASACGSPVHRSS